MLCVREVWGKGPHFETHKLTKPPHHVDKGCARRRTAPSRSPTSAPPCSAPCSSTSTRSVYRDGGLWWRSASCCSHHTPVVRPTRLTDHTTTTHTPTQKKQDTLQTTMDEAEGEGDDEAESLLFPLLVLAHRLGLESLGALCEGYIREVGFLMGLIMCLFCGASCPLFLPESMCAMLTPIPPSTQNPPGAVRGELPGRAPVRRRVQPPQPRHLGEWV